LAVQEPYGIWGGLSEDDRAIILNKDLPTAYEAS
jgi:WhiB family redox-sensing transcriptional regulator